MAPSSRGSIRRRGTGSWQLRVYRGVDPATGGSRYATRTVHGSRRTALRELEALVAEVDNAASHAGTVTDLLGRWFTAASPARAATTTAHTTGARRGQLLALRWRDIDLRDGTVAFIRALVMGPDGPVLSATKTDRTHQVQSTTAHSKISATVENRRTRKSSDQM